MQDFITVIEKIQRNQTETAADLELLKQKEDEQFRPDIEAIQLRQSEVAADIEALQNKIVENRQSDEIRDYSENLFAK